MKVFVIGKFYNYMVRNGQRWNFSIEEQENATEFFKENGFVGFYDLLKPNELNDILNGINEAVSKGKLVYGENELHPNQDIIFAHPILERYVKDQRICTFIKNLLGTNIELQHSKFNAKPLKSKSEGIIAWHQDFPFYPHTNYDLITCAIHLDDEGENSGALRVIPGSHKMGPKSHCKDGTFVYECTEMNNVDKSKSELLTCDAGQVIFHHGLILHKSDQKLHEGHRRHIIYQYRAQDAIQLSGVIWRCTGYKVDSNETTGFARFVDGTIVEVRGRNGRLIDMYGKFKPDS